MRSRMLDAGKGSKSQSEGEYGFSDGAVGRSHDLHCGALPAGLERAIFTLVRSFSGRRILPSFPRRWPELYVGHRE